MLRTIHMSSQVLHASVLIALPFLQTHNLQVQAGLRLQVGDVPAAPEEPEAAASVLAEVGVLSACILCATSQPMCIK